MSNQDDKYEWLKFVEFGEIATKFNADKNTVVDSMDIFKTGGGADKVPTTKLLGDLSGDFSFFALGPIYKTCCIPFDIFGEFREMMVTNGTPYEGPRMVFKFKKPVFQGFNEWDYMFEAMQSGEYFDKFVHFCTTQSVRIKDASTYWTLKRCDMLIYDPLSIDDNARAEDKKVIVSVFLPSGNRFQLAPEPIDLPPYRFRVASPDAGVSAEASALLNIKEV